MLATLMGSAVRVVGGYVADRLGGINTLSGVLVAVAGTLLLCGFAGASVAVTTLLFMLCFAALGAGNGALFQLVPLRWPLTTAVAGSMIGEVGALGGGFLPNAMGLSKQLTGSYLWGFASFALLSLAMLRDAARRADPLDPHLGRKGRPRASRRWRRRRCGAHAVAAPQLTAPAHRTTSCHAEAAGSRMRSPPQRGRNSSQ